MKSVTCYGLRVTRKNLRMDNKSVGSGASKDEKSDQKKTMEEQRQGLGYD
ncbi:MAG: hypothetical protein K0B81_02565 [Candidatus Cloacimonetes bacterium]|nr:hypothetical protein [Candidatus Cloacimonadota bacterium]